jgi:hypothetical protein
VITEYYAIFYTVCIVFYVLTTSGTILLQLLENHALAAAHKAQFFERLARLLRVLRIAMAAFAVATVQFFTTLTVSLIEIPVLSIVATVVNVAVFLIYVTRYLWVDGELEDALKSDIG